MPYPICGQCGSRNVFADRDEIGARAIYCQICGNRYPGAGKGFYMSDKGDLKDLQGAIEGDKNTEETRETPAVRLCSTCKTRKTISPSHDICPSCLAAKRKYKKGPATKKADKGTKQAKMKEDTPAPAKVDCRLNMEVVIDFAKYPSILDKIKELAEDQIRPVDSQIIFILKSSLTALEGVIKGA